MSATKFRWPAPAKINLMLHIVGQREDGYHLLETQFQFIDWLDWLDIEVTQIGDIERKNVIPGVDPEADLTIRAARALAAHAGITAGARISVEKSIPMGAGLGGGSSDAATALVALNEMWGAGLGTAELAEIGLKLGADVPVFIGGQAAFATGVGDELTPLAAAEKPILVIFPACHVETKAIFTHPELTRDTASIKIHDLADAVTRNDCEPVTRALYPPVDEALRWLAQFGDARMSGTGGSVFAMFDSALEAQQVAQNAPSHWIVRVTKGINCSPLVASKAKYRDL
ncbi:MAG: 4-(cytidine 5'-diphospho)-2-C-methyl-D-erythritol kinase [Gammaproteobacteria bacterium]